MTSVLLRRSSYFINDIKLMIINKNKKMINFTPLQSNKTFVRSVSYSDERKKSISQGRKSSNKEIKEILIIEIFKNMKKNIKNYKLVKGKDILNIIDSINSIDLNKVFNKNEILSLLQWCNYISDYLPLEKIKLGQSLWLSLTVHNFELSTEHYNALLKLYVDNEYTFSTAKLLTDMYSKQIYPNTQSYDMCIEYCCKKENIDQALKLIQDMKMFRMNISVSVLNSLMIGYSQSGDILSINEIINDMKQNKLSLGSDTYAAILYAYAVLNDINKVKETIENCYLKNMYLHNHIILNTIYIFVKNNHIKNIKTIYQYLIKKRVITNCELQVILKLIDINYSIAMEILEIINLDNNHPHFKNIIILILKHLVNNRLAIEDIVKLLVCFKNERIFKKSLLVLLYYSLMKCDNLSLSLLKMCKNYYLIKPHYFWPLLVRQAYKYNVQGILDILQIMINDFNIKPCVHTITDYILPFIFGDLHNVRNVLIKYKVNSTVVNNAYVLSMLKRKKIVDAAVYMRYFQDKYFYNIISVDLRCATISTVNTPNFLYISSNLVEEVNSYKSNMIADELCNVKLVSMNRQLNDYILDFPSKKTWFKQIVNKYEIKNVPNF